MPFTIDTRGAAGTLVLPDDSDAAIAFAVTTAAGAAVDLTGNTFALQILESGTVVLSATMSHADIDDGEFTASFDANDLEDLAGSTGLRFRLRNTTSSVNWLEGNCQVSSENAAQLGSQSVSVVVDSAQLTIVVGAVGAGPAGQGVPAGGTTGQALRKTSATDYATEWDTLTASDVGAAATSHTHAAADITSGLATVATSGAYGDLSGTPTIPDVSGKADMTAVMVVVDAGDDLDTARPTGYAAVYWVFDDDAVDVGDAGENITNGEAGDWWFVPAAP